MALKLNWFCWWTSFPYSSMNEEKICTNRGDRTSKSACGIFSFSTNFRRWMYSSGCDSREKGLFQYFGCSSLDRNKWKRKFAGRSSQSTNNFRRSKFTNRFSSCQCWNGRRNSWRKEWDLTSSFDKIEKNNSFAFVRSTKRRRKRDLSSPRPLSLSTVFG